MFETKGTLEIHFTFILVFTHLDLTTFEGSRCRGRGPIYEGNPFIFLFLGCKWLNFLPIFWAMLPRPNKKKHKEKSWYPWDDTPNKYLLYVRCIWGSFSRVPSQGYQHFPREKRNTLKTKRSSQPRRLRGLGQLLKKQWQQPSAVFCTAHSMHELRCLGWKMWLNAKNEFCWFLEGKLIISNFVEPNDRTLFI